MCQRRHILSECLLVISVFYHMCVCIKFFICIVLFQRENHQDRMATLSLRISIVEKNVTKTMQFDPNTSVYDACRLIREKITEANLGQRKQWIEKKNCLFSCQLILSSLFMSRRNHVYLLFTTSIVQISIDDIASSLCI